jgi:hypothetical protein
MLKHFMQKILSLFSSTKPTIVSSTDIAPVIVDSESSKITEPVAIPQPPVSSKAPIVPKQSNKTKSQLLAMNKDKLEEYGRVIGIELDKRKTKNVLVEQLLNHQKYLKGD